VELVLEPIAPVRGAVGREALDDRVLQLLLALAADEDRDDTKYRWFTLIVDDVVLPDRQRSETNPESEEAPAV
jgi:hypothetical protein